jgi:hypothetical protein
MKKAQVASNAEEVAYSKRKLGTDDKADERRKKSPSVAKKTSHLDLSGIELDGEEDDERGVYDNCDELRTKESEYLATHELIKAFSLRD